MDAALIARTTRGDGPDALAGGDVLAFGDRRIDRFDGCPPTGRQPDSDHGAAGDLTYEADHAIDGCHDRVPFRGFQLNTAGSCAPNLFRCLEAT